MYTYTASHRQHNTRLRCELYLAKMQVENDFNFVALWNRVRAQGGDVPSGELRVWVGVGEST